jgi:transposase
LETEIERNEQTARELSLDNGRKLRRIKDQELYRERRQSSFLNYVENHLKRMKRWANQLMEAANVVDCPVVGKRFPTTYDGLAGAAPGPDRGGRSGQGVGEGHRVQQGKGMRATAGRARGRTGYRRPWGGAPSSSSVPESRLPRRCFDGLGQGVGKREGVKVDFDIFMPPRGFQVLPRRWVVERTIAWIDQNRRMSKDYERLPESGEAFIYVAMSRLMLKRLARS